MVLTLFVGKMLDGWIWYISSDTIQRLVAMSHTHLPSELEARAEGTKVLAQLEAALSNNDFDVNEEICDHETVH